MIQPIFWPFGQKFTIFLLVFFLENSEINWPLKELKIINFAIFDSYEEWEVQEKRPVALAETMKCKLIL